MKTNLLNIKTAVIALGILFSTSASAAFTAVASGNWSSVLTWGGPAPTSTVLNQDIIIPLGITVTLDANITFSGLTNNLTVNGVLSSTSTNSLLITQGNLSGTGTIAINKLSFMVVGTSSYLGTINVKQLFNSTTSLAFTAIANVVDTLYLESGRLLLNTNANLTMASNSTVKTNSGSIIGGAGVFNSSNAYNVMYVGNSKTSGIELNTITLKDLTLAMTNTAQIITLNNNTTVNGNLNIPMGKLSFNGKNLTLKGNMTLGTLSTISGNSASDLDIQGTGTLTSTLMFEAGSGLNDFTINRTTNGLVKMGAPLTISGHLNLRSGKLSLESGAMLNMAALSIVRVEQGNLAATTGTFNGVASYNAEYLGITDAITGIELSGLGLNDVTVNYSSNTNKVSLTNSLTVNGNLNMDKGMMDLNGKSLILNGTISQNTNSAFVGNSNSDMELNLTTVTNDTLFFDATNVNSQTLNKLKINTTGTTAVVVGSKLIIATALNLVKGKIVLSNYDLVISPAGSITGYDDTKYVVSSLTGTGSLIMNVVAGSPFVIFPIGLSSDYSPAGIQQNAAGTTGTFSARAVTSGNTSLKVVNRTWFIESAVTTVNANIKLAWVAAAEINGFNRTNAYVSHYTSGSWDVVAAASATVAANNTFELGRTAITSLSPFTVVQQGEPLKINEKSQAGEMTLYPNPSKDVLTIRLITASENYKYELLDLTGRTIQVSTHNTNVHTFDLAKLESGYYFMRATNLEDGKIVTKRFVKE